MKKITLALLSIALLLGSCSIENRHYLPGYFVQWNKNKKEIKQKSNEPQITTTDFTDKQINKEKSIESDNSTVNNNTSENNLKESDVLIASTNDKQIIIPKTESFSFTNKQTTTIALDKPSDNKKNEQKITSSKKKESKKRWRPPKILKPNRPKKVLIRKSCILFLIIIRRK